MGKTCFPRCESGPIPRHVAIIMDGNGRWAKKRGLPRVAGHREGMNTVREITRAADELGIEILTLYSFSTENWKRPREEVDYLMKLPQEFLHTDLDELVRRNVQVRMIGDETQSSGPHPVGDSPISGSDPEQHRTDPQFCTQLRIAGRNPPGRSSDHRGCPIGQNG